MKIAFVYAGGREERWEKALEGRAPSDFFYGAVELAKAGHKISIFDAPDPRCSMLATVYNRVFDERTPVRTRGEQVAATARLLSKLRLVDVVVAASTAHANALAIWKRLKFFRAPLAGIHCGHVNYSLTELRRRSTKWAMQTQQIVLFANSEKAETIRQFEVEPRRILVNPFGVDIDFWTPLSVDCEYILTVGNDGRRDYETFIAAAAAWKVPVKILTTRPLPNQLPSNIIHLRGSWHAPVLTDEELREFYRRALVVVVPLEDALQPSGQSVTLQAMACGRPVVLTHTRGLWIGENLRDGRDLVLVAPGKVELLQSAVQRLLDNATQREQIARSGHEAVQHYGRINSFAANLEAILINALRP